jgi:hypothetical protein
VSILLLHLLEHIYLCSEEILSNQNFSSHLCPFLFLLKLQMKKMDPINHCLTDILLFFFAFSPIHHLQRSELFAILKIDRKKETSQLFDCHPVPRPRHPLCHQLLWICIQLHCTHLCCQILPNFWTPTWGRFIFWFPLRQLVFPLKYLVFIKLIWLTLQLPKHFLFPTIPRFCPNFVWALFNLNFTCILF